jgi:hypothetical protein
MDLDVGEVDDRPSRRRGSDAIDVDDVVWTDQFRAVHPGVETSTSLSVGDQELDDIGRRAIETVELGRSSVARGGRIPERQRADRQPLPPRVRGTTDPPDPRRGLLQETVGDPPSKLMARDS